MHPKNLQQTAAELGEMIRQTILTASSNVCHATPYNSWNELQGKGVSKQLSMMTEMKNNYFF